MNEFIKSWLDDNVWDGDDRSGCNNDWAKFTPDGLQELVCDLVRDLVEAKNVDLDSIEGE